MKIPSLYHKHHISKDYTSIGLFRELNFKFKIERVFYPGSHIHITPSLIFPDVTYADSFKNTYKFFECKETFDYINKNKEYTQSTKLKYYQQDYYKPFADLQCEFDLIISQYAGFVGQATKKYLKKGGVLVCNNSHGDASMASLDAEYKLIAIYNRRSDEKYSISDKNMKDYLLPKSGKQPTVELLTKSMKGIAYTKSPSGYIFRKKS